MEEKEIKELFNTMMNAKAKIKKYERIVQACELRLGDYLIEDNEDQKQNNENK